VNSGRFIFHKEQTMKLARVGVIAAAVLAVATLAFAQAKPDFSGTWTVVPAADAPAGGGGGGRGMMAPITVTQKADTLVVERSMGDNKISTTYKLDGTEAVNKQMGRGGAEVEVKSVAKWDGSKLVITEKRAGQDGAINESTQTWSLGADGMLTIDRTGGRGPSTMKYKKG
jgi:hypothetical protein